MTGARSSRRSVPVTDSLTPAAARGFRRYRPVWSVRPLRWTFAGVLTARLGQTMMPLALLLLFRQRAGGFAVAGIAVAVFGVSAGGELALAIGLRHPDVYGAVFCASPGGGYRPPGVMPGSIPRAYLVAGTLEPFFLENATRWAVALRDAGADVVMTERAGSHGGAFWQEEFPLMVAWAFGPRSIGCTGTMTSALPPEPTPTSPTSPKLRLVR